MSRLFVAVWPPASVTDQLRLLDRPPRPGLRWTTEDQWHVTLRFLGRVDEAAEDELRGVLGHVADGERALEVAAGPGPRALGHGGWVLPVEGLGPLARSVDDATKDIGQPPTHRRFRGHLTLARARRPAALVGLPAGRLADRWTVTEMTLVRSDLTAGGARYDVVGRWPLAATPAG